MNHGVGRLITTAAGCITTTTGRGVRAVQITGVAGGGRPWSLSSTSTLVQVTAGIRSLTTTVILVRVITAETDETIACGLCGRTNWPDCAGSIPLTSAR